MIEEQKACVTSYYSQDVNRYWGFLGDDEKDGRSVLSYRNLIRISWTHSDTTTARSEIEALRLRTRTHDSSSHIDTANIWAMLVRSFTVFSFGFFALRGSTWAPVQCFDDCTGLTSYNPWMGVSPSSGGRSGTSTLSYPYLLPWKGSAYIRLTQWDVFDSAPAIRLAEDILSRGSISQPARKPVGNKRVLCIQFLF